jgi:hypothetical protein
MKKNIITIVVILAIAFTQDLSFDESTGSINQISTPHHIYVASNINPTFGEFSIGISDPFGFPNNFIVIINRDTFEYDVYDDGGYYGLNRYRIDMNNDGNWELDWSSEISNEASYNYPEPQNGTSQTNTIRIQFEYSTLLGTTEEIDRYVPVIIYATPNVYLNESDDILIKLQAENSNNLENKTPILFVEGFDPLNQNLPGNYYNLGEQFINDELIPNNFAVYILNFAGGGKDMRENAEVVRSALDFIHSLCPNNDIILTGLSMGGVISRYALALSEFEGVEHHVGILISYDSPQQGANINYSFQVALSLIPDNMSEGLDNLKYALNSMAAKQLVVQNIYDDIEFNGKGYEHNLFFDELNSLGNNGYPQNCYNVAVSNGSLNSAYDTEILENSLAEINIDDLDIHETIYPELADIGPGSTNPISFFYSKEITICNACEFIPGLNIIWSLIDWPSVEVSINFDPVFIPTASALDLQDVIYDSDYNISNYSGSGFEDIVLQDVSYEHSFFSDHTIETIKHYIENPKVRVTFINEFEATNIENSTLTLINENDQIQSGDGRYLIVDELYTVQTDELYINSLEARHHDWINNFNKYQATDEFLVESMLQSQVAKFILQYPVSITSIISVELELLDPWYGYHLGESNLWIQPNQFMPVNDLLQDDELNVFLNQYHDLFPGYYVKAPLLKFYDNETSVFGNWTSSGATLGIDPNHPDNQNYQSVVFEQEGASVQANYFDIVFQNDAAEIYENSNESVMITAPDYIDNGDGSYKIFKQWIIEEGNCEISSLTISNAELTSVSSNIVLDIEYWDNVQIVNGYIDNGPSVIFDNGATYFSENGLNVLTGIDVMNGLATWDTDGSSNEGYYVTSIDQQYHEIYNQYDLNILSDNVIISPLYQNILLFADRIDVESITIPPDTQLIRSEGSFEIAADNIEIDGNQDNQIRFHEVEDGVSQWNLLARNSFTGNNFDITRGSLTLNADLMVYRSNFVDFSITSYSTNEIELSDCKFSNSQISMYKEQNVSASISVSNCIIKNTDTFINLNTLINDPAVTIKFESCEINNTVSPLFIDDIRNIDVSLTYQNCTIINTGNLLNVHQGNNSGSDDRISLKLNSSILFDIEQPYIVNNIDVINSISLQYTGYSQYTALILNDICQWQPFSVECDEFVLVDENDFIQFEEEDFFQSTDSPCIDAGDPDYNSNGLIGRQTWKIRILMAHAGISALIIFINFLEM